jgi:hypothetical protein
MKLEMKENCAYSLVSPTSMGLRITPLYQQPVHVSDHFFSRQRAPRATSSL